MYDEEIEDSEDEQVVDYCSYDAYKDEPQMEEE